MNDFSVYNNIPAVITEAPVDIIDVSFYATPNTTSYDNTYNGYNNTGGVVPLTTNELQINTNNSNLSNVSGLQSNTVTTDNSDLNTFISKDNIFGDGNSINRITQIQNGITSSKNSINIDASLNKNFANIPTNLFIDQQKNIIDTVEYNAPITAEFGDIQEVFYDIWGTEYSDYITLSTYNIFEKNGKYFALSAYCETTYSYYDDNGDEINGIFGKRSYAFYNSYEVFKLYKDLVPVTYFVYAFEDLQNNQITYNKYIGEIDYINGVPVGRNIPKYTNLVKVYELDESSINICTYNTSTKITDKNDSKNKNVVLSEYRLPDIKFEEYNNHIISDYKENINLSFNTYSLIIENGTCSYFNDQHNKTPYTNLVNLKNNLEGLIKNYSLYSGINVLKTIKEKHYDNLKQVTSNVLKLSPITLYVPTVIYTDNTTYNYIPYEKLDDISEEKLIITTTKQKDSDKITSLDLSINLSYNTGNQNKIFKFFTDGTIKKFVDNNDNTGEIVQYQNLLDREWLEFVCDSNYQIYFKINNIVQDKDLNYFEYDQQGVNVENVEKNIIHFLTLTKDKYYFNKLQLKEETIASNLYETRTIKVNNVTSYELDSISYLDYLGTASTSYNLEYIDSLDYTYTWKYDPKLSATEFITDVLFERNALSVSYSYWNPISNSYVNYSNKILEYNGDYYGSDIFNSNIDQTVVVTGENGSSSNTEKTITYFNTYNVSLVEIFHRSRTIKPVKQIIDSTLITNNNELTYNTVSNIPFELQNQTDLVFNGKYEYVQPIYSYIISKTPAITEEEIKYNGGCVYVYTGCTYNATYGYTLNTLYNSITTRTINLTDNFSYIDIDINIKLNDTFNIEKTQLTNIDCFNITTYNKQNNTITYLSKTYVIISYLNDNNEIKYNGNKFNCDFTNLKYAYVFNNETYYTNYLITQFFDITNLDKANTLSLFNLYEEFIKYSFTDKENYNSIKIGKYEGEGENKEEEDKNTFKNFDSSVSTLYKNENETEEVFLNDNKFKTIKLVKLKNDSKENNSSENTQNIIDKYSITITEYNYENGFSYSSTKVINKNGFWKREYDEIVTPLINVSYSFASNSIDISNAYIVPTTLNETLGFVHNNKISYNRFVNSYIEKYEYTYFNEYNIECKFDTDIEGNIIIPNGNKYFGLQRKKLNYDTPIFTYETPPPTSSDSGKFVFNYFNEGAKQDVKITINMADENFKYGGNNITNFTSVGVNLGNNTGINIRPSIGGSFGSSIGGSFDNKGWNQIKPISNIYYDIKNVGDIPYLMFILDDTNNNINEDVFEFNRFNNGNLLGTETININKNNKDNLKYTYNEDTNVYTLYISIKINDLDYDAKLCDSNDTIAGSINELIELHRRLIVTTEQKLEEVVLQEEEYIAQNAQIHTPFGIVNGKKVVITDQVYVPASYTTIVTIDPVTNEYITQNLPLNDPYFAYTYEIEDIPLITATYIYNDADGIKIQGMDTLIQAISGGDISSTLLGGSGNGSSGSNVNINRLPTSYTVENSLKKLGTTLSTYLDNLNEKIENLGYNLSYSLKNSSVSYNLDKLSYKTNNSLITISYVLSNSMEKTIDSDNNNTSNIIMAQKSMMNNLTSSIDKQTTTLSRMMMINMIGGSGSSYSASIISDILEDMTESRKSPQNWQSITRTGYQFTYEVLINSYKATSYKHTKVIGRDLRNATYVTRTGVYNFDNPEYVDFTYTDAINSGMSSNERIGLHLSKESRSFTYNGYVYHEDYYTYQNIADILSDLHISTRLPNRKEFIVDVSKELYVNSDFVLSYTSPNEYAIRAIRRADILWNELVKANIVEDSKTNQRPIPEVVYKDANKWWLEKDKLIRFAEIFDINTYQLSYINRNTFITIDNLITSTPFVKASNLTYINEFFGLEEAKPIVIDKITTNNRYYALADMFNISYQSLMKNPQVINKINEIVSPYKTPLTLKAKENLNKLI